MAENWLQRDPNWQPELPLVYCEQEVITQRFRASPFTAGTRRAHGLPGGSVVENLPATQESRLQFLGQKDPLEKETAAHSNILPWTEEPGGLQSLGSQKRWI